MQSALADTRQSQGFALIISLIFLIVLSILGLWGLNNNVLQEKISGNTRDYDLAFEAAESVLHEAENNIQTWRTGPFNGSAGLYDTTTSTAAMNGAKSLADWQAIFASGHTYRSSNLSFNALPTKPRFIVKKLPVIGSVEYYQVTAQGIGRAGTSSVILQTIIEHGT